MPSVLQTLIESGRIVDVILLVLAVEVVGLGLWRQLRGHPMRLGVLVAAALPGACLLLALRGALTGAEIWWVALWLAASFPAHLLDLRLRPP